LLRFARHSVYCRPDNTDFLLISADLLKLGHEIFDH
jgi:hypothetical protein